MRLHIADGYDPAVYDFTWSDFAASCGEYSPGFHTWVVTVFNETSPNTFTPVTGCLIGWDERSIRVRRTNGTVAVVLHPDAVYVLGAACKGHP